jgi:hypothetical protein
MNSYSERKLVVHVMLVCSSVIPRSPYTRRNLNNYLLEVYIALDTNVDGSAPVQFLLPCMSAMLVASLGAPPISNLTRKPQPTVAYTCTNSERTSCHCPYEDCSLPCCFEGFRPASSLYPIDHIIFVTEMRHSSNFHELPDTVKADKTYLRRSTTSIRHGA